jgi:transposase-like protein
LEETITMEARMRSYTETERLTHVGNWKSGTLSRAAYAKSAGIIPTTFYTWIRQAENKAQDFVEIHQTNNPKSAQDMIIEKGSIIIRLPLSTEEKELKTIFKAFGN